MKSRMLLTAAMLSLVVGAAEAAPRKKSPRAKAKATAVQPQRFQEFGDLAKLEGASWQDDSTGTVATFRWLVPGDRMQVEYRLSTGSVEEALIARDPASGGLILTRKDSKGRESGSTASAAKDGLVTETIGRGDAVARAAYKMAAADLLRVETAALSGGVWKPGQSNSYRRLSSQAAAELRSAAHQQMLKRWGALAGLAGKSWRREQKGEEHLQSFAWEVPGEVLIQKDSIVGKDPSRHGRVTIYRFDSASSTIMTSQQAGQSKPQAGVASIEADGVVALKSEKSPSAVTFLRLVSPGLYQVDSGKIGKSGFNSKDQLVYALETASAAQARAVAAAQAEKLADSAAAQKSAQKKSKSGKGGILGGIVGAAKSVVGGAAGSAVLQAVAGGAGHALGSGLVGMLSGAAGGGAGAAALAAQLGGKSEDALSAAILAQTLGGGGDIDPAVLGMGASPGGGGLLGKLTGGLGTLAKLTPMGMVGSLAVGALAKAAGGTSSEAAGLQLMFAAIKSEDPGALLTAIRMMETSSGAASSVDSAGAQGGSAAAATGSASANSKGTVKPGSYPTRPNTLIGKSACRGYTNSNYKTFYEANQGGPDTQLHTMCAAAFNYYSMYLNAIRQGYNQADANLTYGMFEKTAATAIDFRTTGDR